MPTRIWRRRRPALELGRQVAAAGRPEGGKEAEEEARKDRQGGGEGQDPAVQADLREARQVGRTQRDQELEAAPGEEEPDRPGGQGEQQALGEDGADQAPAPRRERGLDRHLPAPPLAAHDKEVGDVDAGDEEDRGHGSEEDPEDFPGVPHHHFVQGEDAGGELGLDHRVRVLGGDEAFEVGEEPVEVVLGLYGGDSGAQAS
jgi:hypothetical protein